MSNWPPENGMKYIRSEEFGLLLISTAESLSEKYPQMDFTDGVASLFDWFDRTLKRNRRYINKKRFPTLSWFQAYIKQALFNAGRMAERKRQRSQPLESLPPTQPIVETQLSEKELNSLHKKVSSLSQPHQEIFERRFFEEESSAWIASCKDMEEAEVEEIYIEAIDKLTCPCMMPPVT